MHDLMTVIAVLPAAQAVSAVIAAHEKLSPREGGKLIGLMVAPILIPNLPPPSFMLPEVIDVLIEASRRAIGEAESAFTEACNKAGVPCEWRMAEIPITHVSSYAGGLSRAADLIIAPQCPEADAIGRHEADQLVLASGRPVLTLPVDWTGPTLGSRALVAWNGRREAARAVFDALPLLRRSEAVRLLSVRETAHEQLGQFTPGDEIAATLARHGVEVDVAAVHCERASVSEEIRAHAQEFAADLLVMGCYGHSRLRETILGGVTHDMLRDAPIPLLLSS